MRFITTILYRMTNDHTHHYHLILLLLIFLLPTKTIAKSDTNYWYDCSTDEQIPNPKIKFLNVTSNPTTVTRHSGQTIYKTIHYDGIPGVDLNLETISADFHQYYKVFDKRWTTFLHVHKVPQCDAKGNENLCPLKVGESVEIKSVHPPLGWYTPYGMYRSRQVWRDGSTEEPLGCVDMEFEYRADDVVVGDEEESEVEITK